MLRVVNILIVIYLVAPIVTIVVTAFGNTAYPMFPPPSYSLRWFVALFKTPELLESARISAMVGALSALLSCVIGTASALALVRARVPAREAVSALLLSPILFPAIVLGLALLVFYNRIGMANGFFGLVFAHTLVTTPFVLRLVMASLTEYDISIEQAARNLGASPLRVFRSITLPLIRPGVVAGGIFAFVLSFDELVVTLFLAGPSTQTLPVRIYNYVEFSSTPLISAVSTCLIAIWLALGVPIYQRFLISKHH